LVWNDVSFMEAFTANYGFVNSNLAAVYKVPAPAREYDRVEFPPEQQRSGLLGQALFLTLTSKLEDTAPTGRGLFVRESSFASTCRRLHRVWTRICRCSTKHGR
jgi:hypothetical protein